MNTIRPKMINGDSINKELVSFHVKNVRAQLAKQYIGKYGVLDNSYVQSLGCVELTLADKSSCCSYPTGCKILRTNIKIPQTINGSTNLLTRVGPVNMVETGFQHIEFERVPFSGLNRFTRNLTKWFKIKSDDYVYVLVDENTYMNLGLEVINIQGIFSDPEDVRFFVNCSTGETCFNSDSQFPVPVSLIPIIQDIVIKNFIGIQAIAPIDSSSDGKIDPISQVINK